MKRILIALLGSVVLCNAQIDLNVAIDDIRNANTEMKEGVTKAAEGNGGKEENTTTTDTNSGGTTETTSNQKTNNTDTPKTNFKSYQNYDFVPGEKILFEDNFLTDMDGEFPAHWDLTNGQAVINKIDGKTCFLLTDGNYCRVNPLVKNKTYLGSEFTVEFDYYMKAGSYGITIGFFNEEQNEGSIALFGDGIGGTFGDKYLFGNFPEELHTTNFYDKWHHISIAFKNGQIKVYADASRILTMPNVNFQPVSLDVHGIGDQSNPIIFTNVKIAEGGKMNMLDKIMTDGKIITHGILFDINKATIKPESMGVLNQIYQLLKDNADLKFEIDGYTDADGDDNSNLKLSEQRAIAVKEQLVAMGISADRLTTKGFGETNPIDVNTTIEGKANNRRVEFIKK